MREMIQFRRQIEPQIEHSIAHEKRSSVEKSLVNGKKWKKGSYTATRSHNPDLASLEIGGWGRGSHEPSPGKLRRRTDSERSETGENQEVDMSGHEVRNKEEIGEIGETPAPREHQPHDSDDTHPFVDDLDNAIGDNPGPSTSHAILSPRSNTALRWCL